MKIQGKGRKMDFAEETSQLIKKIEQHPAIWNKEHSDYRNIPARRKCWEEITESLSPAKISQAEKNALSAHLQNRWKNIRDRFSRTTKFGDSIKRYVYSSKLKFLLNSVSFRKYKRPVKCVILSKSKRAPSKSAKVLRESKRPPPEKRTRIGNGLEAPTSKKTSSASLDVPVVPEESARPPPENSIRTDNSLEVPISKNTPSASLDVSVVPEEESRPSPEKSTRTDSSLEASMSKNTPSASLDVPEEESRPSPEKSTRTDNSLEAPMSKNTPSASLDIPDVPEEELKLPPRKRTRTGSSLEELAFKSKLSKLSDILDASEQESEPPSAKRTRTDSSLVETKLIEFLERNMAELQGMTKNNQDEDQLFLLSLLTSLKSIQPLYKLKAKIEILSVLDKYQQIYEESNVVQPQIVEVMHSVDQSEE